MDHSPRQHVLGLVRSPELLAALRGGRELLLTLLAMSAALNVLLLSGSLFMLLVYDEVLPSRSTPSLVGLLVILLVAFAFQAVIDLLRNQIAAASGDIFERSLSERVFTLMLDARPGNSGPRDAVQPVRDLDQIRSFFAGPGPLAILDLPWVLLFLGILFAFHYLLGLLSLSGAAILVILTIIADRMTAGQVEAATRSNSDRFAYAETCRRNAETMRAIGMAGRAVQGWRKFSEAHAASNGSVAERLGAVRTFSKSFRLLLQSLILACGAWLVINGRASAGVIIASSILAARALSPIEAAISSWRTLVTARQAWNRLAERLSETPAALARTLLPQPCSSLAVETLAAVAPGGHFVLFHDVSFRLAAGESLAIVGPSGSGKSSLARALVGVLPPARGAVRLDGAAIDQWDADVIGAHIGYLPQDIELFDGTIAQNIARFDTAATSEEIVKAAQNTGIHELVVRMPDGYDTLIGPHGHVLSAGQRQRVALARALYKDPFLLVLDEPNSNLDAAGEEALNRAIAGARARGAIVILVAHRPSALSEIGHLLWLENGKVREIGAKADVLPLLTGSLVMVPAQPRAAVVANA